MALQELKQQVHDTRIALLTLYYDYLSSPELRREIQSNTEEFHRLLIEAKDSGWIHYTRLASAMDLAEPTTASRWFKDIKEAKTPDQFRRRAAVDALSRVVENDIGRLKRGLPAIGGKSMKDYPRLEIVKIGEDEASFA
ncbi:MAG: hypothetical protein AAGB02_05645 [Pseudomonadota bacterium]